MKAMITGASSGIGREFAVYLSELDCDLILVAKDKEKLEEMQSLLKKPAKIVVVDLADEKKVKELYMLVKNDNIDILINNAGFGLFGDYKDVDLNKELDMINVNLVAVHILTRLFLKEFVKNNKGYILNVSSSAGLLKGGPLMSCYYATKSYVVSFTNAIYEELRRNKSKVHVSCLCPGPVDTNFNNVANVKFSLKGLDAREVARYAVNEMIKKNRPIIIPGFKVRLGVFMTRFISNKRLLKITYKLQKKKRD